MSEDAALKLIPYGNSGFRSIRCDGFAYADKTRFIETLERSGDRFMLIVRPRRFGKTLFTETLNAYYDKSQAPLFEKSFRGTYIGSHRTPLASQFYVLKFIFAGLSRENPEGSFLQCVRSALVNFFNYYPHPREQAILGATFRSATALIEAFFAILGSDFCQKVFVIIDEYDHLANAVLSRALKGSSAPGFFKDFYAKVKSAASDTGPVARIYVTGVTAMALDAVTPGFSIARNVTTHAEFATLCGFTEAELRQLILQVIDLQAYGHSLDEIVARMKAWYGGYRFSLETSEAVLSPSMCLYCLDAIRDENDEPDTMLDPSFAQDLQKISGILSLGDPDFVKGVVEKALQHEPIDFPSASLQLLNVNRDDRFNADCVLSAMFYMGYLTFAPNDRHKLVVPNRAVGIQFFEYYLQYILSLTG